MPVLQLLDNTNMDIGFFVIPNKKSRWKKGEKRVKNAAEIQTETKANYNFFMIIEVFIYMDIGFYVIPNKKSRWEDLKWDKRVKKG